MASTAAQGSQGSQHDDDMPDLVTAHGYQDLDHLIGVDPDDWTEKQREKLAMQQAYGVATQTNADRDFDALTMSFDDAKHGSADAKGAELGQTRTYEQGAALSRKPSWEHGDDREMLTRPGFTGG